MRKLLNWLRRRTLGNDLDCELRYHLERRTDELMRAGRCERPRWSATEVLRHE